MRFGYSEATLAHDPGPGHPESPARIPAIREALADRAPEYVDPGPVSRERVEAVHDSVYLDDLQRVCSSGGGRLDPDTVAVPETWAGALAAAGTACWAAERALAGDDGAAAPFALSRPPGHHATAEEAMGFCFLNNVAIAAEAALGGWLSAADASGTVAIVDLDVHHGNGTAAVFDDRADVFYLSVHEGGLYPGTGQLTDTGSGPGEGRTCNLPLPAGTDDADYCHAFDRLFKPLLSAFAPDLLLVSAGFDAHRDDEISGMELSTDGFGLLADRLRSAATDANAGLGFVLEGGYALDALGKSVVAVAETFDGQSPTAPDGGPADRVRERVDRGRQVHGL